MITLLKIIAIPCMIALIIYLLMNMGFIPSEKIIVFIKNRSKTVQVLTGIGIMIGLLSSIIVLIS